MWNKGFEGWYFKHQKGDDTLALIPGLAESGAFVQLLLPGGAQQFDVPSVTARHGVILAGNCRFSRRGCRVDLPGVQGTILYGETLPLRSDIMGPFRFLPMECRHGVLSMAHRLRGSITVDGTVHNFDGGLGYLEKDSGTSFPKEYLWLQCNDFARPLSIMLAIAHIPFARASFTGCLCALMVGGQEYRFATYYGVRIHAAGPKYVRLSQGKLLLELDVSPTHSGHALRAPVQGQMSVNIRESVNAMLHVRLWEGGTLVVDDCSAHAAYEYVPCRDDPA